MKSEKETVKIDSGLLLRINDIIKKNKIKFSSAKQFVNIAVSELLKKEER